MLDLFVGTERVELLAKEGRILVQLVVQRGLDGLDQLILLEREHLQRHLSVGLLVAGDGIASVRMRGVETGRLGYVADVLMHLGAVRSLAQDGFHVGCHKI